MDRLPGVKHTDVQLETGQARIVYDDARQTPEKLAAAIDTLGFRASVLSVTAPPKPTLYVEGIKDRDTARKVERALRGVKGVTAVTVDPGVEVYVDYDRRTVEPRDLVAALKAAGFKARAESGMSAWPLPKQVQ